MLKGFRNKIRGYIPYTNWWLVWRALDKSAETIMDLGCGTGKPMQFINRSKRFYTAGVDGFQPSLDICRREKSHDVLCVGDLRNLNYAEKTFDVVLCLQALEHLEREDGDRLLRHMIDIACKQVIVTTDVGEFTQSASDGNTLQEHKYIWGIEELWALGFQVYGIGLKGWGGEDGYSQKVPEPFRWIIGTGLQVILGPIMYRKPQWANAVLCVRNNE